MKITEGGAALGFLLRPQGNTAAVQREHFHPRGWDPIAPGAELMTPRDIQLVDLSPLKDL